MPRIIGTNLSVMMRVSAIPPTNTHRNRHHLAASLCATESATATCLTHIGVNAITENRQLNPHAVSPRNKDGSFDISLMQINTGWLWA